MERGGCLNPFHGQDGGLGYDQQSKFPLSSQVPFSSSVDASFVSILRMRIVGFSQVRAV